MYRKFTIFLFYLLILHFSQGKVFGQQTTIAGKVIDGKTQAALPGVTAAIKGTTVGAITDANGIFKLTISQPLPVSLVVGFVGYTSQEIEVYDIEPLVITLKEGVNRLNEVIVTGYSSQERRLISGSITTVSSDDLKDNSVSSFNQLLQGKAAGVQVSSNSGVAGGGITFRVRGSNSINAAVEPLYIIDGVIVNSDNQIRTSLGNLAQSNPLSDINPSDIENVVILKDANATAIYGSLGANGVVLVTTKRGQLNSKAKINVDISHGWSNAIKKFKVANGVETGTLAVESYNNTRQDYINHGQAVPTSLVLLTAKPDTLKTYDRISDLFRTAHTSNYEVSVQGGNSKSTYYVGLSYFDQQTIVKPTNFNRYTGKFNYDNFVTRKLKVGTSFSLSRNQRNVSSNDNNPRGVINSAIFPRSYLPIFNADGTYARWGSFDNHLALIDNLNNDAVGWRTINNLFAEYSILPELKLRTSWSVDNNDVYENNYSNSIITSGGSATSYETKNIVLTNEQVLTFNKAFGTDQKHSINALIGNTLSTNISQSTSATGTGFAANSLTVISVAAATTGSSTKSKNDLVSYFGKASYTFADKYTIDGSFRADASSKFGKNNRWGYFPSGGIIWRASQESFIKNLNVFDELKFRASIGLSGNQNGIDPYASLGLWSGKTSTSTTGINYLETAGTAPYQLVNADLTWETTRQIDFGTEFEILKSRISVVVDYYRKYTYDLLLNVPVPYRSGFSSYLQNYGAVSNNGVELTIHTVNIKGTDYSWTTDFSISKNKNRIEKLASTITLGASGRNISILKEGYAVNSFQLYKQLYVDPQTGNAVYEDISNDGKITSADRQIVGSALPDYTGGFTNNITFKGFDLNAFFFFQHGNKIMNMNDFFLVHGGTQNNIGFVPRQLDRWQQPGDVTDIPRLTTYSGDPDVNGGSANNYGGNVASLSSRYLQDGSYIRFKRASLGYTLPISLTSKWKINKVRFYISGENLLTFTKYNGLDPEVSSQSGDQNTVGYDWATVPQPRTFLAGINLTF